MAYLLKMKAPYKDTPSIHTDTKISHGLVVVMSGYLHLPFIGGRYVVPVDNWQPMLCAILHLYLLLEWKVLSLLLLRSLSDTEDSGHTGYAYYCMPSYKPSVWDCFLKIEFDASLISSTLELTHLQARDRLRSSLWRYRALFAIALQQ